MIRTTSHMLLATLPAAAFLDMVMDMVMYIGMNLW